MTFSFLKYILFFLIAVAAIFPAMAQQNQPQQNTSQIELVQADALEGGRFKGQDIRKLIGNVVFKQKGTMLYCDSAYQYKNKNMIEAFGSVRINQGDTVTITGNRLTYNGDTRLAKMKGNVVLNDSKMTLTTPSLDYRMDQKMAYYTEGGVIVDADNRLTSRFGQYSTSSKVFNFRDSVEVVTKDGLINSQALDYNTVTKIAYFNGPTRITNPQGVLIANKGSYDTVRRLSDFKGNSTVETASYTLAGDTLLYNEVSGYGFARGNVRLTSKKDSVVITGKIVQYWRQTGISKVYGQAVMHRPTGGDTLFLAADTLMTIDNLPDTVADLTIAYPNVRIWKADLQGRCDSLTYNSLDSTIYMSFDPILWSGQNQIVANDIRLLMANKQISRMEMYSNAFLSSQDTLRNYNQVKGRNMTVFFKENKIRRVNVDGNGESIYFVLEGDTALTGMNYAICSNMVIQFDSNKVKTISFLKNPDAKFIPPHELEAPDTRLKNFTWRIKDKPSRTDIIADSRPRPVRGSNTSGNNNSSSGSGKIKVKATDAAIQNKEKAKSTAPAKSAKPRKPATGGGGRR